MHFIFSPVRARPGCLGPGRPGCRDWRRWPGTHPPSAGRGSTAWSSAEAATDTRHVLTIENGDLPWCRGWYTSSTWPSDVLLCRWSWSTLVHGMACCLMVPSHGLNQCWLIFNDVLGHLFQGNVYLNTQDFNLQIEIHTTETIATFA